MGLLGQPQLSPEVLSPLPHVGLKLRVRSFSSPGSKGGGWGWGGLPSAWESGPRKQKLAGVARLTRPRLWGKEGRESYVDPPVLA